ncbi:MAG: DNA repair protein RadC [Chthoniobacterales bacterium]|nr:DNA repair protein RadC [Chthoniobacterales bacterium]
MSQLRIREMPPDERPREKLLARGADALTNAELIAILLRTGRRGVNVVEVARELLRHYKSFAELSRCTVRELRQIRGIGAAKALELVAAFNLGKRFAQEPLAQRKLDSPGLIHELLGHEMRALRTEAVRAVLLDTRYHLIRVEPVSVGTANECIAHPREIFRAAITYSAYAVIVVHNHPSGDPSPSKADHELTRRLANAADVLKITLLDHIIIGAPSPGNPGYFSFKEAGVL